MGVKSVYSSLSDKLSEVFRKVKGEATLNENNIKEAVKEVRFALLEADVNFKVVKEIIASITEKANGEEVQKSLTPGQVFVKIVHDELVAILSNESESDNKIKLSSQPPTIILMAGLQGSGKTTCCGKLAKYFIKQGRKVVLVGADIYRPAAMQQLKVLAEKVGAEIYLEEGGKDAVAISKNGVEYAKKVVADVVIVDTAGRLQIDEVLMKEVRDIKEKITPHEVLYVADSMTGQEAVNTAKVFHDELNINGVVLSKVDGDSRGGAVLSIKYVTGCPIKFISNGETPDDFDVFHAERIVSRILGMGDIVSMVEKIQSSMGSNEAEIKDSTTRMLERGLDFNDLLKQFDMIGKMGSLASIASMIPGLGNKLNIGDAETKRMAHMKAIIQSMTPFERKNARVLDASRKRRIARGSGTTPAQINQLINQLNAMNKMIKSVGKDAKSGKKMGKLGQLAQLKKLQSSLPSELTKFMK